MDAITKYMQTSDAKKKSSEAKDKAWTQFVNQFPNADVTQFVSQVSIDQNNNFSPEVFFKASPDLMQSVFGSDRQSWSQKMKTALGVTGVYGFPYQLSLLKTKLQLPTPAVDFTETAPSIAKIFNKENKIYATSDEVFITKFCDIFKQTRLKHTTSAEAKTWLRAPNMKYWPQQLNLTVFCATLGCAISHEIFDSGLSLTPQIRVLCQFHEYFTIRRILYQLGGIRT